MVLVMLVAMIPITLLFFCYMQPRRAALAAYLFGWMYLPIAGFEISGLPNFDKISVMAFSVLLGILLFDAKTLASYRPAWYDIPMYVFLASPFMASITNGLGAWDGVSAVLDRVLRFGVPYYIGRIYFNNLPAMRDLAIGIIISAIFYMPLCWWEIRMSPQLHYKLYGYHPVPFSNLMRYGGFKPTVFMVGGLMVSMWILSAATVGMWMWGVRKGKFTVFNFSMRWWVPLLVLTVIGCKSVGAIAMILPAFVFYACARWAKTAIPIVLFALAVPGYMYTRTTGLLERSTLTSFAALLFDQDRVESLDYRLRNEDELAAKAMQQATFGWGRWNRNRVTDVYTGTADSSVTDGLWIVVFGQQGMVGLVGFTLAMLLPALLFIYRYPAQHWFHPWIVPAAAVMMIVLFYNADNLLNAKIGPIINMAWGGLIALGRPVFVRAAAGQPAPALGRPLGRPVTP